MTAVGRQEFSGSRGIPIAGCARLATGPQPTGHLVDHIEQASIVVTASKTQRLRRRS